MRTWKILPFSLLIITAYLFTPMPAFGNSASGPGEEIYDIVDCQDFGILEFSAIDGLICMRVAVPEDYDNPGDLEIKLAVTVMDAADGGTGDPLFVLSGGPGGGAIEIYTDMLRDHPLRENHDIVVFDQRGTQHSLPFLYCNEVMDGWIATLLDEELVAEDESAEYYKGLYDDCYDRYAAVDQDLDEYNSLNNATDIELLRNLFEYDQIDLLGVSYGSLLAQHYMREYPSNVGAVILDGVVSPEINFIVESPAVAQVAFDLIFETCEADAECSEAFPDIADLYRRTYLKLEDHPLEMPLTDLDTGEVYDVKFNHEDFRNLTFQLLYSRELLPFIPRMVSDIANEEVEPLLPIISAINFDRTLADAMYFSTICAEDADFSMSDMNVFGLSIDLAEIELASARQIKTVCDRWDIDPLPPSIDANVVSDTPVLLLSGAFDPITPYDYALNAAEGLSVSTQVLFSDGAHSNVENGSCAEGIVTDFINDPSAELDTACAAEGEIDFFTGDEVIPFTFLRVPSEGMASIMIILAAIVVLVLWEFTAYGLLPLAGFINILLKDGKKDMTVSDESEGELITEVLPNKPEVKERGSWLASALALILPLVITGFYGVLLYNDYLMSENADFRVLYGVPVELRWVFTLPALHILLSVALIVIVIRLWRRRESTVLLRALLTSLILPAIGLDVLLIMTQAAYGLFL